MRQSVPRQQVSHLDRVNTPSDPGDPTFKAAIGHPSGCGNNLKACTSSKDIGQTGAPDYGNYLQSDNSNLLVPPRESNWCDSSKPDERNSRQKQLVKLVIYAKLRAM